MVGKTALVGAAGEHYVMSELLRRDVIAALAPTGAPHMDIVVSDADGKRLSAVQVKTKTHAGSGGWSMGKKHEDLVSETLFYVFVDFGAPSDQKVPCFILPAPVVAQTLSEAHQAWLAAPGRGGRQHNDTSMRRLMLDYRDLKIDIGRPLGWLDPYQEAWELITGRS